MEREQQVEYKFMSWLSDVKSEEKMLHTVKNLASNFKD
jgi:hypothetical protein